jgi:anti-sigma factor RsiW
MNCEAAQTLVDAYIDGELDPAGKLEIERHLEECARCASGYAEHGTLKRAVGAGELRFKAPPELQQRIRFALRAEAKNEKPAPTVPRRWFNAAAALAIAALALLFVLPFVQNRRADDLVAREVLAGHIRSLMADHLADVASSDQHTVKPWFDGRLDSAPPVRDLTTDGFPLVGGRLDYLDGKPAAALVYRHRKHLINLFVGPADASGSGADSTTTRKGYNVRHWVAGDMSFWLVSDLEMTELAALEALLRKP